MDILDDSNKRPDPNVHGVDFDCQRCGARVEDAFYDRRNNTMYFWCDAGHESVLEEVMLDI